MEQETFKMRLPSDMILDKEPTKTVVLRLNKQDYEFYRKLSKKNDIPMSALFRNVLSDYAKLCESKVVGNA
jgi:hypothetical protein